MRLIHISDYDEQTMQLARPVYDGMGRILLTSQQRIHAKYLEKLKLLGVEYLVIEDRKSQGITLDEMIDMPAWIDAIKMTRSAYENAALDKPLPLRELYRCVDMILEEVRRRPIVVTVPSTSMNSDLVLYAHAVNVTLLSLQIARALDYNDLQLRDLALGCLLHDIGKMLTTDDDQHPEAGFNYLRKIRELKLLSAHIAFQHHETIDGKGYPRGLRQTAVLEYAQICGVANLYDHLVSLKSINPYEAYEIVMMQKGLTFENQVIDAFIKGIAPYPPGTVVRLSNGKEAIVTRIESSNLRPVIRYLESGIEIPLVEHPSVLITEVC